MNAQEFAYRDATEIAGLIRTGELSPVAAVECAIELIEQRNPTLNAVILRGTTTRGRARPRPRRPSSAATRSGRCTACPP